MDVSIGEVRCWVLGMSGRESRHFWVGDLYCKGYVGYEIGNRGCISPRLQFVSNVFAKAARINRGSHYYPLSSYSKKKKKCRREFELDRRVSGNYLPHVLLAIT